MKILRLSILAFTALSISLCSCAPEDKPAQEVQEEKTNPEPEPQPEPEPEPQPAKKLRVGILGDSISTFKGWLANEEYDPFYPDSDPNVGSEDPVLAAKAVDSAEKTWWYRLIYNYMKDAELDVNSSWQGTRIVHEQKKGYASRNLMDAGFIDRCLDFKEPDVIFIHGGTNDKTQETPIDEYTGAYRQMIGKMKGAYPGVRIILIIGDRLNAPYASPIIDIAREEGLRYVDFRGDEIEKCKGSHPTAPAFDFMAGKIARECADILPTVFQALHSGAEVAEPVQKDSEQLF